MKRLIAPMLLCGCLTLLGGCYYPYYYQQAPGVAYDDGTGTYAGAPNSSGYYAAPGYYAPAYYYGAPYAPYPYYGYGWGWPWIGFGFYGSYYYHGGGHYHGGGWHGGHH